MPSGSESNSSSQNEGSDGPGAKRASPSDFGSNAALLAALILLLTVLPFLPGQHDGSLISRIIWSLVIVAGILRASGRRIFLWGALIVAIPSLLSSWFDVFGGAATGPLVVALFFGLLAAHILADIFSRDTVEVDQILGGINVYLLLGVLFARLHVAVESFTTNSYMLGDLPLVAAVAKVGQRLDDVFLYYSFTTLTTLGYGDIRPVSEVARMASTVEAVVGQLFVAILIARLVSVHASRSRRSD